VLGLDPDPARLWPAAVGSGTDGAPPPGSPPDEARALAAAAVAQHCRLAIEAAGPACVAVKLQMACFERLGSPGWDALEDAVAAAREHGLLVIADGKRGDVPVTAAAYAQALVGSTDTPFGPVAGLGADAITANPLLGRDALEPLIQGAADSGAGVFVLVRTSNPGGADLQDRELEGRPLYEALAAITHDAGEPSLSEATGLSSVGAVTGATRPDLLQRLRELMPHAVFLLPGVGAQGGTVEDLAPAWSAHPAGGLVTASRSIVNAYAGTGTSPAREPAAAARDAAEELRASAWALAR
jgi:orotidine-5'-phosphate decarboxylase